MRTISSNLSLDIRQAMVNGALLSVAMTLGEFRRAKTLVLELLVLGLLVAINWRSFSANSSLSGSRRPAFFFGFGVITFSFLLVAIQAYQIDGLRGSLAEISALGLVVAVVPVCCWNGRDVRLTQTLTTLALMFACVGLLNLAASKLGLRTSLVIEREQLFESRYQLGQFRWQAPLYSSWQLSGLLRWAIPILLLVFWRNRKQGLKIWMVLAFAGVAAYGVLKTEYRAGVFPIVGFLLWFGARNDRRRALLATAFVSYAIVAPLLFQNLTFIGWLEGIMPDLVFRVAGAQDISSVLALSGRTELWNDALGILKEGKFLFMGEGHVRFDATPFLNLSAHDSSVFEKTSFHQAFLDLLFIYGVLPAVLLLGAIGLALAKGVRLLCRAAGGFDKEAVSLAVLNLGLVSLSNCHDGFVLNHFFYYFIVWMSCIVISQEFARVPALRRRGHFSDLQSVPSAGGLPSKVSVT